MPKEMSQAEAFEMMSRCLTEIKTLNNQIQILRPKARAYEHLSIVLDLIGNNKSVPMSEDITWVLQKRLEELRAHIKEQSDKSTSNLVEPNAPSR